MKITKAELKQVISEEIKNVFLKQSLINENWQGVLGDEPVINTAIEKLKTIQSGEIKNLLDDNEYLKKFLVLLYYVDEYKKMEGTGGFGEDLEKYLPPEEINKLENDAKTMAQVLERNLLLNFENTAGYYPLYTFLGDLGDYTIKTVKDFKAGFQKAGEETTKVAKLNEGEEI